MHSPRNRIFIEPLGKVINHFPQIAKVSFCPKEMENHQQNCEHSIERNTFKNVEQLFVKVIRFDKHLREAIDSNSTDFCALFDSRGTI